MAEKFDLEAKTERTEKNWEGVRAWTEFSGTGEQAQFEALKFNLGNLVPKLESTVGDYQTDGIKDEKVKEFVSSAKEFLSKAKEFLAEER